MCYTYNNLNRVTKRIIKNICTNATISTETFSSNAAGNVTSAPDSSFQYDTNNSLVVFNRNSVSYNLDGNMLNNGELSFTYDSANRLISAGGHTYTYNAENVRVRNLCGESETTYVYDTSARLSKLLMKTTDGTVTKYVYGRGLIGEATNNVFKTYHFDCRGSTVAITNTSGTVTDTFTYDTYGKLISRTGTTSIIFGYNGRDGVVTDDNSLIYMRARYYSPEMRRFINADIIHGEISDSTSLNRYAYVNGNPVSFVDPLGLGAWDWINGIAKAVVAVTVVVAATAVIAGTGGTAAPIVLGIAASAAIGGYFNEQAGGNFFSGAVGGAVGATTQTLGTFVGGPAGTAIGGSIGSGIGTAITETIDNLSLPKEYRKSGDEILKDSVKTAGVALITSTVTAGVTAMTNDTTIANELMPGGFSDIDKNVFGAFFGAVDDAATYIILNNNSRK